MKKLFLLPLIFFSLNVLAQDVDYEKSPVFPKCESQDIEVLSTCFKSELAHFIHEKFKTPQIIIDENYKGNIFVLFEVTNQGNFKVLYTDATYTELKTEIEEVFNQLPKIQPATYNGRPIFKQYSYKISIPLEAPLTVELSDENIEMNPISKIELEAKSEYDDLNASIKPYEDLEYSSTLNVPFLHSSYAKFDRSLNLVGTNSHTAAKPFMYSEVIDYYDFKAAKDAMVKESNSWWQKKLFNEHLVQLQGKGYWFTLDPIFDLQVGKDSDADFKSTFNNTRGFYVQGGLGEKLSFSSSVYESQGRFADYINRYAESLRGFGPDPAVIPGRGIAKRFKNDAYDYPVAEAYLSYSPTDFLNVQFGHGKNFIGDGYRSLLQSDVASPSPFLKLSTKFWKIKYTNTWMWLKDIRTDVVSDKAFLTKYMANHYLSWNVSKKFNLGLFESVLWTNSNNRGFDVNYLNPIIFYRAIEFETGQGAGNAVLGATAKYKVNDNINIYSQFVLDEFSLGDIKGGERSWKNKYGYQLGMKYYNAFKVDNLYLQLEYNRVRPYTYSHNTIVLNYGHNNQSMAHLWGANFSEAIVIGRYNYKRWFADAKLVFGSRGLDYNNGTDDFSYGGDIYRNYNDRPFDTGVEVEQGIKTNIFHAELQSGYVVNPATNLKLFAYLSYRDFNPNATTATTFENNTLWFSIGLRTDLFNWYFDF
ncbi:gliding motility protein RemB [Flavobacteriaceae bacterium S0825]|uniref:gliding motility protein RemB n=1 Tax=Gaetbulibacter sp. S0825 TaxID=2720084 RepID=UPI001431E069|nr:gliding motility protein RemB [Gaetbulibacter sp. S0825]MCK0108501.1 gliding motility protein RemB [Flavobacteriaceae bacterium S0825]NIX64137.1 gliding motility protein RemB [Gaetbulibacter sp. S0825]